ncbi:VraH family protein [Staphylococcus epidermidis]|nr:VraH family protein [Staphylococcus epidermidis]MDE4583868.1 VraH family protein [Staphylococcus epidermidis]MDK7889764.1 VraH family protein [Staphylococcus epidermidis]
MWLIFVIVIASMFTTPLLGVPIGIVVYFLLFNISDETK